MTVKKNDFIKVTLVEQDGEGWVCADNKGVFVPAGDLAVDFLKAGDTLGLIQPSIRENGRLIKAELWVYEPDYLFDVSALAECFQRFGGVSFAVPALAFLNKLRRKEYSLPIFKGNLANFFLDAILTQPELSFQELFKSSFSGFALEYMSLFPTDAELLRFMREDARNQFRVLQAVTNHDFQRLSPPLLRNTTMLEPAFLSPELGLQGRLDAMTRLGSTSTLVELKSGKPPWPEDDDAAVNENHAYQAHMYNMLINRVLGLSWELSGVYLLYSSARQGTNLRKVKLDARASLQVLQTRNTAVFLEKELVRATSTAQVMGVIMQMAQLPAVEARIPAFFTERFSGLTEQLSAMNSIRQHYFATYLRYIVREQWLARMGHGVRKGARSIWSGDDATALGPAFLIANELDSDKPRLRFKLESPNSGAYDFRAGDLCLLYPEHEEGGFDVGRVQLSKGVLEDDPDEEGCFTLFFRHPQRVTGYFETGKRWMIHHDHLDVVHGAMLRELFEFCVNKHANDDGLLKPASVATTPEFDVPAMDDDEGLHTTLLRAAAAPRLFLLVGPPGTGKTTRFLSHYVRAFKRANTLKRMLLIAYTNRAADEICQVLHDMDEVGEDGYFRIGTGTSCDERYRPQLVQNVASQVAGRDALRMELEQRKIVVCTAAAAATKGELIRLFEIDTVIVDEASQVVEPLLINLLSKVRKFILIGDQKQLPAVSLQMRNETEVENDVLRAVGLHNLSDSLFDRLLRLNDAENKGVLARQGRMHPVIASFVNHEWYDGVLHSAGVSHQLEPDVQMLGEHTCERMRFVHIDAAGGQNEKTNIAEAEAVVAEVERLLEAGIAPDDLGVVVPFRAQAAEIRKRLKAVVSVDTVERYQGSQRDVILFCTTVHRTEALAMIKDVITDGVEVDRKLNVAITRARKQFVLFGNTEVLSADAHYAKLLLYIQETEKKNTTHA
ncbi:MAG: hypothetical protein RL226_701 [Bacteroidota bacterium]